MLAMIAQKSGNPLRSPDSCPARPSLRLCQQGFPQAMGAMPDSRGKPLETVGKFSVRGECMSDSSVRVLSDVA